MTPVNPLSMVGLMLTLASLVGSFFYVQLSQWLRDVQALRTKISLSKFGNSDDVKKAVRECRIEQARLASWHTMLVNVTVLAFVWFVLQVGFQMIAIAQTDPLAGIVRHALLVFEVLYLVLSIGLFALGIVLSILNGRELKALPKG
jgi:hypothetical protein